MEDLIPENLLKDIKKHLATKVQEAERKRSSFFSKEDPITSSILTDITVHTWQWMPDGSKWRIKTHQVGNHGNYPEKTIGADGIIQISVYDRGGNLIDSKGMLFQAKKSNNTGKRELQDQIKKMSATAGANASAVFIYDEDKGFYGYNADEYALNMKPEYIKDNKLGKLISEDFLDCKVGKRGLYYSHRTDTLFFQRKPIPMEFSLNNVLHIEVSS